MTNGITPGHGKHMPPINKNNTNRQGHTKKEYKKRTVR